jgi:1,2-phenylacetyl-CoA epoxidase PaaB subunit
MLARFQHPVVISIALGALGVLTTFAFVANTSGSDAAIAPPDKLQTIAVGAGPEEMAMVADGKVGQREYEAAVANTQNCVRAAGFPVSSSTWDGRVLSWHVGPVPADQGKAADAAYQDCYVRYQRAVDVIWAGRDAAPIPSSPEQRARVDEALRSTFEACLLRIHVIQERGLPYKALVNAMDQSSSAEARSTCLKEGAAAADRVARESTP